MIREAVESDIPNIQAIGKAQRLFNYGFYIYRKLIKRHFSFVMELADQIVGYIIAFPISPNNGFCLQVGVNSKHQNQGIGTELFSFAEKHLKNTFNTKFLFAHTIKKKSLTYFTRKLAYNPWWGFLGFNLIYKELT